ncbi:hypothetical protein DPMN_170754 [Dreissena polymorpha]|uniref:Uncharacterized protein n=1 Tax=Dreissena polymorpha TaxID=45954 RepID=A0A9D4DXM0_DREPO|nr:hypothetical protein DPMN_170754 [Dreissena polymorpha]
MDGFIDFRYSDVAEVDVKDLLSFRDVGEGWCVWLVEDEQKILLPSLQLLLFHCDMSFVFSSYWNVMVLTVVALQHPGVLVHCLYVIVLDCCLRLLCKPLYVPPFVSSDRSLHHIVFLTIFL